MSRSLLSLRTDIPTPVSGIGLFESFHAAEACPFCWAGD